MGRLDAALALYARALEADPGLRAARWGMAAILEMARTEQHHPGLAALLDACLADPATYPQALARAAAHQLRLAHGLGQPVDLATPDGAARIGRLARDRLFLNFLRRCVNLDADMERFLTALRRHLLLGPASTPLQLGAALALQSINNERAFWAEPDEVAALEPLIARLRASRAEPRELVQLAMYRPLDELGAPATLTLRPLAAWPEPVRPVLRRALHDPAAEAAIAAGIQSFTSIADAVSQAVRAQYEANPYPRWLDLPPVPEIDLLAELAASFPTMRPAPAIHGPLPVLSAGCGTGQHALSLARNYRNVQVTAFDLSRRSLAYAIRQARRLGIQRIEFLHGDILELDRLGKPFAVIESIGVIHHMADPAQGLRALVRNLLPGGLVRLGLYSERARAAVLAARQRIAVLGLGNGSADAIRHFRHLLLRDDPGCRDLAELTDWDDFFTISAARDLLFHVHEHRYSVPLIAELVAACGLHFLGFEFPAGFSSSHQAAEPIQALYRRLFPGDPGLADLANWARLEDQHPELFKGYTFWAQKPAM